ncbi:MAG: hypothetical protein Q4G62_00770 [Pseudomonadota bacterium]|nr:hypothetical protein [Pseudomonadota bacterium]
MKMLKTVLLSIILAMLALPAARAQPVPTDTPEAVVAAMNASMAVADWQAAAAWFDPQALQDFRAMLAPLVDAVPDAQQSVILAMLFAGSSAEDLKRASDAEFFASFMAAMMRGKLEDNDIIGSVAEGDELRHVVTRATASAEGVRITKMEVVSLRKTPHGWRAMLKGDMTGMVEALKSRMGATSGQVAD